MATNIFNYNGTLATTIADGALDTSTSIAMPGRGYLNYGESVNQDMLWIMQNFSNTSAPQAPVIGQLWYNPSLQLLKVYNGTAWIVLNTFIYPSPPGAGTQEGALWYDSTNLQLKVWDGTKWDIVGPLASQINTDPINPSIPPASALQAARITDTSSTNHDVWEIILGGVLLAIFSADAQFTTTVPGFTTIYPGLNFSTSVANSGTNSSIDFTNNKNNLPVADNLYNMGSASFRFANMHAVNFIGQASSALYADVAESYHADEELVPGTVVCLGGEAEITATTVQGTDDVFGVVSTNPAYLMNSDAGNDATHPAVAMTGRVPCRVVGPVKKGQRLMASLVKGCACAYEPSFGLLAILGRSLVSKDSSGIDTIEIVIGKN